MLLKRYATLTRPIPVIHCSGRGGVRSATRSERGPSSRRKGS
ncbi:hypothetical protein JDM601_4113 [Mycolicibacter sinensis]|uniref:Uncharacterized protein n=1 Tax=Mycolicibacter sinensis (strain JDM601) TaxID=875328 RepID=F5YU89_MYCSD|nr:hypothetical protein JDM601_4113 [Mycolicibacter sinensis]